ncbi:hypothetical protein [uncultured Castellaniella sp.]|uniref:sodium:solute symporter family protein n=1 Tax=uncultured Castellaniella sp. TaxID=647907 RepID=UPI002617967B|nr:hypothetical protein [uncultured Castellaniella sp.]
MIALLFGLIIAGSVLVAYVGRSGAADGTPLGTLIAGRSLPSWLIFFLAVGEIYSIGTMLGFPGGIYAKGASYGIWFIGYILMGYIFGYFLAPLVWRAGKAYGAVTVPDVMYGHYRSRFLEKLSAATFVLALFPWAIFQFIGLQVVLSELGLQLTRLEIVVGTAIIAFLYVFASGMRSTALVTVVKDTFMFLGIVLAGIAVVIAAGGLHGVFEVSQHKPELGTVTSGALVFAMTTIFVQSVQFYMTLPAQFLFSAKSESSIKKSVIWMPLYMLMYPLLVFVAYYGVGHAPNLAKADRVFLVVVRDLAPPWIVGLIAAGAGLAALIVLAGNSLMFAGVFSRNLCPSMKEAETSRSLNMVMAAFLIITAALSTFASSIMLTFLTLALALTTQLVPAWFGVMFFRGLKSGALCVGMIVGCAIVAWFYFSDTNIGNINSGLVALVANFAISCLLSVVMEKGGAVERPVNMRGVEILSGRLK